MQSLGAGGSLVVAALCCLLLATAFLTFRDWPGRGDSSPGGTITLTPPAAKVAGRAASGPSAPAATTTAAASAPVTDRTARRASARRGAARRAPASAPAPAGTNPPAAAAPAPVAAPPAAATSPAGGAAAQQAPATQPAPAREPGTVEAVVEDVRQADDALPLPPVVEEPVKPVLDTVQQAGRTVDETAGPLLPALP